MEYKNRTGCSRDGLAAEVAPPPGLHSPVREMQPRVERFLASYEFGAPGRRRRAFAPPDEIMEYFRAAL
eukprot:9900299-Lingulodinium_polyedra.AAC.1